MRRRTLGCLVTLVALTLLAGCGSSGSCKSACKKIAKCMGISLDGGTTQSDGDPQDTDTSKEDATWTCPLSSTCTPTESCYARCINKASCDAITGANQEAAKALAQCQLTCDTPEVDATAPDGGPPSDGDVEQDSCVPECGEQQCGDDGCGGSCGTCESPLVCNTSQGQCVESCTPDCSEKQCGADGCGGSCGTCGSGYVCDSSYQCKKSCTPSCSGKQCGDDGCGGSCGTCGSGYYCDNYYQCKSSCTPSCSGKQCGDDGCGGSCGTCGSGYVCSSYQCAPSNCSIKEYSFDSGTMEGLTETHSDTLVRWQVVNKRHYSPTYSLYYGDTSATNYAGSGTNYGVAYLPSITVPSTGTSSLTFWVYMDVESGTSYDVLSVVWDSTGTTLWTKSSTITMKKWEKVTVSLSTVQGKTGQLRLVFKTVDGTANTTEGVYVDSMMVQLGCQ